MRFRRDKVHILDQPPAYSSKGLAEGVVLPTQPIQGESVAELIRRGQKSGDYQRLTNLQKLSPPFVPSFSPTNNSTKSLMEDNERLLAENQQLRARLDYLESDEIPL